jgi:tetratricopeptide (TPR) repeat protein
MVFPLLVRLVYSPGLAVPRALILDELWPCEVESRRNGNLRQLLYKLRLIGLDIVQLDGLIRLSAAQVVPTFSVEQSEARFAADVEGGGQPFGEFLPAWPGPSALYQEWLEGTRATVHAETRRILVERLRSRRERADWSGAERYARWLRQFDPLNEDATLVLAESTLMSGSKAEAVAILDDYLEELGPDAREIRLPAAKLKRRLIDSPPIREDENTTEKEDPFVGRAAELLQIASILRRAKWHDGSMSLIFGSPGLGKSRLLIEARKIAILEGFFPVSIQHREAMQSRSLFSWIEILPTLMALPGALGCAPESIVAIESLIHPATSNVEETTNAETNSSFHDLSSSQNQTQKQSIRRAIIDLLASISEEQPVALFAEDCHWADEACLEVFNDLSARSGSLRLAIFLSSRTPSISDAAKPGMGKDLFQIPLKKLTETESRELARLASERNFLTLTSEAEDWIVRCCEGNPLQVQALTDHWAVTGSTNEIPPSLHKLLELRLSRIPTQSLRVLQAIRLLDRHASIENLRNTLEVPNYELLNGLEDLERNECLVTSSATILLTHELIGQAAIRTLSKTVESAMREVIASHLEKAYLESGDIELLIDAFSHLEFTNRNDLLLQKVLRHSEALIQTRHISMIRTTSALISDRRVRDHDRKRLTLIQAQVSANAGEFGKALSLIPQWNHLDQDVTRCSEEDIASRLAYIESAFRSDPLADPKELGRIASKIVKATHLPMELRLRAADIGLVIAGNTCDQELANACFTWTLELNESSTSEPIRLRLGLLFHTVFGSTNTAHRIANVLIEKMSSISPSPETAVEIGRAGYVLRMIGEFDQAKAVFTESLRHANALRLPRLAEYPVWQLAQIALEAGDLRGAESRTQDLLALTENSDDPQANSYVHSHLCLLAIGGGDFTRAEEHLKNCKQTLPLIPHIRSLTYALALEILIRVNDPSWTAPPGLLEVAIDRFERTSCYAASDLITAATIELMLHSNRIDDARVLFKDYTTVKRRERGAFSSFLNSAANRI